MTSKQILDAFSERLISDERVLSFQERELVTALLQNARVASDGDHEVQTAVMEAIRRTVGETVTQRALMLLGTSIVERIVSHGPEATPYGLSRQRNPWTSSGPQPPTGPAPNQPAETPRKPEPTTPAGPQPPTIHLAKCDPVGGQRLGTDRQAAGILEPREVEQARSVVLDEFLAPQELEELVRYALRHEREFRNSEVIAPTGRIGVTDYSHRRSRVLMELGAQEEMILTRIRHVLPLVLEQLDMEQFPIRRTEVQISASNDGDFFRAHCDDGQELIARRRLTFVYFFHREPTSFSGGELRLHDSPRHRVHEAAGSYETIVPEQNQIVFFPCSTLHEITPVRCASRAFADSRFTVNGWLHH